MSDLLITQLNSIDKVAVLQEARIFHDSQLSSRKCIGVLARLLILINQRRELTCKEATDVFFAITRLIKSKDVTLRYLVYICIKELANQANDVIIMTSSVIQDITNKEGTFRSQAIRTLCKITDSSMISGVERYIKHAIVDQSSTIVSSALVSAIRLASTGSLDIVKRWSNEILQAVTSDTALTQYHALAAMCTIRQGDRIALLKLIDNFIKSNSRSSFANVLIIRIVGQILLEELSGSFWSKSIWDEPLFIYVQNCLHHNQDMVVVEAANCISNLPNVPPHKVAKTVSALQLLLSSDKLLCRFTAIRVLNKIADSHSDIVSLCNADLEGFLRSTNRSTCTMAITTLLKTSDESSVDQLLQQVSTYMSDMTDDHRSSVVDAIKVLTNKKHKAASKFLATMLREEGGMEFKDSVVDALSSAMKISSSARAHGLAKLCEFIEDCEYENLTTKILYLLGSEAMQSGLSSQHIRYIYNRIVLESPIVRSAAVTALARIAASDSKYRKRVLALLRKSLFDEDDAVRDRAAFYYSILQEIESNDLDHSTINDLLSYITPAPLPEVVNESLPTSQPVSESSTPTITSYNKFDLVERLSTVGLGQLLKSSSPVSLTESELEYQVRCVKHLFEGYIVFEYLVENTLDNVHISNVRIDAKCEDSPGYECVETVSIDNIRCHEAKSALCVFRHPTDMDKMTGLVSSQMNFLVKDVDPQSGDANEDTYTSKYEDSLNLDDLEIFIGDYMAYEDVSKLESVVKQLQEENSYEVTESFVLPQKSIPDAMDELSKLLGYNQDALPPTDDNSKHPGRFDLKLAGRFMTETTFVIVARLALIVSSGDARHIPYKSNSQLEDHGGIPSSTLRMNICIKSNSENFNQILLSEIC